MGDKKKKKLVSLSRKQNLIGWGFLLPASLLIILLNFYPGIKGFLLSLQVGHGMKYTFGGIKNYVRILRDSVFKGVFFNTFFFLIIQVPIMLMIALVLASMLNNKQLRFKGIFRTALFLPCATSLVSYSMIFRSIFATDGLVNNILWGFGLGRINWFGNAWGARIVMIIALIWRWTGYNMVFYSSGLQNIESSVYEAAKIDGASPIQSFFKITVPLLRPTILLTTIMSTNGTLQLFDESVNLTGGGPGRSTMTLSHYIYNTSFTGNPNMGYATAMSFVILVIVAILAFAQMKVGDKR